MRSPKTAVLVALVGAVAIASAAYGIGTQSDDGTAVARDDNGRDNGRDFGPPGAALDDLAQELGVDPAELRDAARDFFEQRHGDRRDAFTTALAKALGKPVNQVEAALEQAQRGDRGRRHCDGDVSLRRLAGELDVTRAELRSALNDVRAGADADREDFRDDVVKFLADRFNLSEDKVRDALPDFGGPGPDGPGRWGPGPDRWDGDDDGPGRIPG